MNKNLSKKQFFHGTSLSALQGILTTGSHGSDPSRAAPGGATLGSGFYVTSTPSAARRSAYGGTPVVVAGEVNVLNPAVKTRDEYEEEAGYEEGFQERYRQRLEAQGHDALHVIDSDDRDELVLFKPRQFQPTKFAKPRKGRPLSWEEVQHVR